MAKDDFYEIEKLDDTSLDKPTPYDFMAEITTNIPPYMKETYQEAINKLREAREEGLSPAEVGRKYLDVNSLLQELLLTESIQPKQSPLRSLNIARAAKSMETQSRMAVRQAELTQDSEQINPYGPKFQMVLRWLLEAFDDAMDEAHIDQPTKNLVTAVLAKSLRDFETKIDKNLKGATFEALKKIKNPFVEEFIKEISSTNPENKKEDSAEDK